MPKSYTIDDEYHDSRLDKWFKNKIINLPHSLFEKILRQNKVKVNKKKAKSSYRLQTGDLIEIYDISKLKPAKNIIDILKNSKYFENSKPFIVHRLDKETSGVLIIAKNRKYAQLFTSLFRIRKIHKTYLAIVYGKVEKSIKVMKDDLIYYENNKKTVQRAVSNLRIIKSNAGFSYLELNPITGRKHQLRRQLLNIGCPIIGDDKYFLNDRKRIKIKNLLLHAYKIKFMINNIQYSFKAKYNNQFEDFLKKNI